jgi:UDP-glucose 4-epimerase
MNNRLKTTKAVITGGAGFIGSHIAEELLIRGWRVTVIDDLSTGSLENIQHLLASPLSDPAESSLASSPSSLSKLPSSSNFDLSAEDNGKLQFIHGTITDLPFLQKHFSGIDYIFHEAAIPSVPKSVSDPLSSHEANLTGSLNVLLAARDNQVKKVICASSCAVYGDEPTLPKQEDMAPVPLSPYASTKLGMEYYCRVFSDIYHLSTVCLRYFNVYGSRQSPNSDYAAVIPKFIQRVQNGLAPVIFGDGEQSRDFIFVKDVVGANLLAAEGDARGVFNIGSGQRTSLNQLTRTILELCDRKDIPPIYERERPGDIKHSVADIGRAKSFGFVPKYSLCEGLEELLRKKV